ncbi:MAG: hypothetical protein JOZ51_02240, partial [Chloroflexi bacterium]|nr:hypothetical protein [Chloroflexota bacterium]
INTTTLATLILDLEGALAGSAELVTMMTGLVSQLSERRVQLILTGAQSELMHQLEQTEQMPLCYPALAEALAGHVQ